MHIPLLYEDDEVLVINKPAGLMVHADGVHHEATLADWILEHYPALREVGEPGVLGSGEQVLRPGIVHRLDKGTSGVLIVAKNNHAFITLKRAFQEHTIAKTYLAISWGAPADDEGSIALPIGRHQGTGRWTARSPGARTREALTHYRVRERLGDYALLELKPKTGRTHQLRVHLAAIGHPVLCDGLYAPKRACPETLGRLALHALSLSLTLPSGKRVEVVADPPEDFERTLAALRQLC